MFAIVVSSVGEGIC